MMARLIVAAAKPAAMAAARESKRKANRTAARGNRHGNRRQRDDDSRPQRGFGFGGKIEDDPEAEGDGEPGDKAGPGLHRRAPNA